MQNQNDDVKRDLQANHKVEANRLADFLDMDDDTLRLIVDLYNRGELNAESAIALEALEALE